MILVVKVGTSSITDEKGELETSRIKSLIQEIARLKSAGHKVVLVSSGAIAAGRPALTGHKASNDYTSLQAYSTIGQSRLQSVYESELNSLGLVGGQVLLTLGDFNIRSHYLRVRDVVERLLSLDVVPIVNENDAITDEEIRFGDNDRLAAMMAHLVGAELLVLLTDTEGLHTANPELEESATLIKEVETIDKELKAAAGGTTSDSARGGMASKLAAAGIATWSGIRAVIASSFRPQILTDIVEGKDFKGTQFKPRKKRLSARKLWIAFAAEAKGSVVVDEGAHKAVVKNGKSLLPVGIVSTDGSFAAGDGVEVKDLGGNLIAKGIAAFSAQDFRKLKKQNVKSAEFIHRDDLVVLEGF